MAPKKEDKVVQLKGKEAEDRILQYMKECNRPYGAGIVAILHVLGESNWHPAADVSANIRNVVSKPATQKILATLAERGAITQKVYGKTCYYVANQSECEEMSPVQLDALETRCNIFSDKIKEVAAHQRILNADLARIRSTPDDTQLGSDIVAMQAEVEQLEAALTPLRVGSALLSDEQVRELDREWLRWRSEWVDRKKVFSVAWGTATDSLSASESAELVEELGQFEACTLALLHLLTKALDGVFGRHRARLR
ncbi:hypothetical protein M407DRAFT_16877 [Tulasnella calospora MUT 4182]|uniref:Homologous-pairing protein 2 winged helix domain-containing protein n=1 Tax=Tulasnella calospora MUT 4182 TaxID=1051891 RepID=A0A0C3MKW8_9AGAM|nr:hypothetical protein M407DRAFT_16877 [Tulasnella calospora MUT 4182]